MLDNIDLSSEDKEASAKSEPKVTVEKEMNNDKPKEQLDLSDLES